MPVQKVGNNQADIQASISSIRRQAAQIYSALVGL